MGNPVWPAAAKSTSSKAAGPASTAAEEEKEGVAAEGGGGGGRGKKVDPERTGEGGKEEEEERYRLHVVRRLTGLVTLDCADVTEEERNRAKEVGDMIGNDLGEVDNQLGLSRGELGVGVRDTKPPSLCLCHSSMVIW